MVTKALIVIAIFLVGVVIGTISTLITYRGGTLSIQNEDPENELLEIKFTGDVDSALFEADYILFKIDRSRYHDSQEKQGL